MRIGLVVLLIFIILFLGVVFYVGKDEVNCPLVRVDCTEPIMFISNLIIKLGYHCRW